MATFDSAFNNMLNGVQGLTGTYDMETDAMLNSISEFGGAIKTNGLNSQEAERLNNMYNQFNNGIVDYNKYYDNLLNSNSTNKQFIENLESQGAKIDKSFRKDIGNYRQQYIEKVTAEKNAAKQYFEDIRSNISDLVQLETNYTPQDIGSHIKNRNEYIQKNIDPYVNDAVNMIDNMKKQANLATQEIATTRDEFLQRISNPNATQEEVKQAMKDFNSWTKDYQKGAAGTTSFNLNARNTVLEQQKTNLLSNLETSGYGSEETKTLIESVFEKASSGHKDIFGESGAMKEAAISVNDSRLDAMRRITSPNANPDIEVATQQVKNRRAGNALATTDAQPPRMVADDMSMHRIITNKEGNLTAELLRNGPSPVTPSDALLGSEAYPNGKRNDRGYFEKMQTSKAKEEAKKKAEKIAAGMTEEAAEMSTAKRLLKKHGVNSIINLGVTIADYKESRREGQGVVKSAAKAGVNFAIGETLGMAAIPFYLAGSVPTMAVKAIEGVNKMERQMNSMARSQPFADTYFQDTQQLATMRQSGMEMAKMSQYNLQQTLMGAEATHMHK